MFNLRGKISPSKFTYNLAKKLIVSLIIFIYLTAFLTARYLQNIEDLQPVDIIPLASITFLIFLLSLALSSQPRSSKKLSFKVPMVPFLPIISIFINIYLMMKLSIATWIRFFVWLAVGLSIYFFYGIRHSNENDKKRNSVSTNNIDIRSTEDSRLYGSLGSNSEINVQS